MGHIDSSGQVVRPARPMTAAATSSQVRPMTGFAEGSSRGFTFGNFDKFAEVLDGHLGGKRPLQRP